MLSIVGGPWEALNPFSWVDEPLVLRRRATYGVGKWQCIACTKRLQSLVHLGSVSGASPQPHAPRGWWSAPVASWSMGEQ